MDEFELIPADLRDIAEELSAGRVTPTALELDDLYRRVRKQVATGSVRSRAARTQRLPGVLRTKLVGSMLALWLVLAGGAGIALAGGGSNCFPNPHNPPPSSWCQYKGYWEHAYHYTITVQVKSGKHTYSQNVTLTIDMTWSKNVLSVYISFPGQPFTYQFHGSSLVHATNSVSVNAPHGTTSLTVVAGGNTITLPISW